MAKAQVKLLLFHPLAAVQGDGLAVFAHPHQVVAEVGLQPLLLVVQRNLRFAHEVGDQAAHRAVQHRHPHHEAGDGYVMPAQAEVECAAQPPQDAHKAGQRDHRVEQPHGQRHGIAGELVHILLDTLVGVVWAGGAARAMGAGRAALEARQLHAVEGVVAQPALQVLRGHPGAPAHLQQLRQVELVDRDDDEGEGQGGKTPQLLPEHGLVFVLQRVVEHPVPLVQQHQHVHRRQVQHDDGSQQGACLPLLVGLEIRQRQAPDLGSGAFESGEFSGRG